MTHEQKINLAAIAMNAQTLAHFIQTQPQVAVMIANDLAKRSRSLSDELCPDEARFLRETPEYVKPMP